MRSLALSTQETALLALLKADPLITLRQLVKKLGRRRDIITLIDSLRAKGQLLPRAGELTYCFPHAL